jgi:phage tail-like protein
MAKSTVNPHRFDPYKNFKFRITIDGKIVAGIHDISGLVPPPASGKQKARRKIPGLQKFGNITLKRGITQDTKFLEWINSAMSKSAPDAGLANFRKSMMIEYCNELGDVIASYRVINGWVTKIEAPDLNANVNDVAIESIELSYEGLELIKS